MGKQQIMVSVHRPVIRLLAISLCLVLLTLTPLTSVGAMAVDDEDDAALVAALPLLESSTEDTPESEVPPLLPPAAETPAEPTPEPTPDPGSDSAKPGETPTDTEPPAVETPAAEETDQKPAPVAPVTTAPPKPSDNEGGMGGGNGSTTSPAPAPAEVAPAAEPISTVPTAATVAVPPIFVSESGDRPIMEVAPAPQLGTVLGASTLAAQSSNRKAVFNVVQKISPVQYASSSLSQQVTRSGYILAASMIILGGSLLIIAERRRHVLAHAKVNISKTCRRPR